METKGDGTEKQLLTIYNLLLNLFWSALILIPIVVFCYTWVDNRLLLVLIGLSSAPVFLSRSVLDKLRIGNKAKTYKKLGIQLIQLISQNGVFVKYLIQKKSPKYKVVRREEKSIEKLLIETYVFEKFHLVGLLFFFFLGSYAVANDLFGWALFIILTNLLYNVYPILLQQYIRVKLALYLKRSELETPTANPCFTKFRLNCSLR